MSMVRLFKGKKKDATSTGEQKGRKRLLRAATIAAAASILIAPTASAAPTRATPPVAIKIPNPASCAWNATFGAADYFWFKIGNVSTGQITPFCFVDAGIWTMSPTLNNVYGLHSGNNAGLYTAGGRVYGFNKWEDNLNYIGSVSVLGIY
jgi:hypothetical protein